MLYRTVRYKRSSTTRGKRGYMFEKEFQEWFELNKKWLYSMDHVQAAYSAWCAGVKQQQAVEQPLAPDGAGVCAKCGTRSVLWVCRVCGHDNRPAGKA